jgi:hypothetical protein
MRPGDSYLANNLPIPETAEDYLVYGLYVVAHQPALAMQVIAASEEWSDFEFSSAVLSVNAAVRSRDQHIPLSPERVAAFPERFPYDAEKVETILDWAADSVSDIMGWRLVPCLPLLTECAGELKRAASG